MQPPAEDDADLDSWIIGKALAGTVKPRPKVMDLNDADLEHSSWIAAGLLRPRPKLLSPPAPPGERQMTDFTARHRVAPRAKLGRERIPRGDGIRR